MALGDDKNACDGLAKEQIAAWIRILSAIQTSESMESHVLEPLLKQFENRPDFFSFLQRQSQDEQRHSDWIKTYLLQTFAFHKQKPTLSDRIFYKLLFPLAKKHLAPRPAYALGILLFYEHFSIGLYKQLLKRAQLDGLCELQQLIITILKDEAMHLQGVTQLIKSLHQESPTLHNRLFIKLLLKAVAFDVNFGRFAFHNRDIRNKLHTLQIDPELINQHRHVALQRTVSVFA